MQRNRFQNRGRDCPVNASLPVMVASLAIAVFLCGCASTLFETVDLSEPFELAEDEGLLAFRVDTKLPIRQISWDGLEIYRDIEPGLTRQVVRLKAGRYSWRAIRIPRGNAFSGRYRIRRSVYNRGEELDFEVLPGQLNYAGDVVVRPGSRNTWHRGNRMYFQSSISVRIRNRSGSAIRYFERNQPEWLDRFRLHLAADSPDRFIDFYMAERARIRAEAKAPPPATRSRTETAGGATR